MTYDSWKVRNPEDEMDWVDSPEVWVGCEHCGGEGFIEKPQPFHDDPYYGVSVICEECSGAGGHIEESK